MTIKVNVRVFCVIVKAGDRWAIIYVDRISALKQMTLMMRDMKLMKS